MYETVKAVSIVLLRKNKVSIGVNGTFLGFVWSVVINWQVFWRNIETFKAWSIVVIFIMTKDNVVLEGGKENVFIFVKENGKNVEGHYGV